MAWPVEQGMILAHEMSWRCRHPHSSLQPWVIPWLFSFTKQLLHEEINVCATNIIYMAWILELKAYCIQFALNTVIKSDPLLTKLIMCLGKEGARPSRHLEYTCTHIGNAMATKTKLHPLNKGSDTTCRYSYTCAAWKVLLPRPYMLLWGREEKDKWTSELI